MTNVQAALELLSRGLSVVPLRPGRKKASIPWEEFQKRVATEDEVRAWWKHYPKRNVGIITGAISGIVVVDVDTYKGGSTDGLPDTGVIQRTGRGGLQYFYRHPGRPVVGSTGIREGIDIRGDGNYIAVAPSDTTDNPDNDGEGGPYTWVSEDWDSLGEAPAWALGDEAAEADSTSSDDDEPKEKWVTKLLQSRTVTNRNTNLTKLCGFYASKGLAYDMALELCEQWNNNLDNPLGRQELLTTVRSVFKAERRRNRSKTVVTEYQDLLPMTPMGEYMEKHGGSIVQWLVKDWLPDSSITMLISPPQSYKTYLAFDLAVSVASGMPFMGKYPVLNRGPVAIFQQEDPHTNIAERMALISWARLDLEPLTITELEDGDVQFSIPMVDDSALPIYYHEERKLRFDDPAVMDALEAFCAKVNPRLVIIDPLYSAAGTEDFMAKAAQQMMRLKDIRDKYGTGFVVVHHTKKAMDSWDREKLWGSQFLNAFIETSWMMRRRADENRTVVHRHTKVSEPLPFIRLTMDIHNTDLPWRYAVEAEEISGEEAEKYVKRDADGQPVKHSEKPNRMEADIASSLAQHGPATLAQLATRMGKAQEDVDKAVRSLMHKHRISQGTDGRWASLDLDNDGADME